MSADIAVEYVGGRPRLAIDAGCLAELVAAVDRLNRQRIYAGQPQLAGASEFVSEGRRAVAIHSLVVRSQPSVAVDEPRPAQWVLTAEAARILGVSPQAITKRARAGTIRARKVAGAWWIRVEEMGR